MKVEELTDVEIERRILKIAQNLNEFEQFGHGKPVFSFDAVFKKELSRLKIKQHLEKSLIFGYRTYFKEEIFECDVVTVKDPETLLKIRKTLNDKNVAN
jgi:hypothetical protein